MTHFLFIVLSTYHSLSLANHVSYEQFKLFVLCSCSFLLFSYFFLFLMLFKTTSINAILCCLVVSLFLFFFLINGAFPRASKVRSVCFYFNSLSRPLFSIFFFYYFIQEKLLLYYLKMRECASSQLIWFICRVRKVSLTALWDKMCCFVVILLLLSLLLLCSRLNVIESMLIIRGYMTQNKINIYFSNETIEILEWICVCLFFICHFQKDIILLW